MGCSGCGDDHQNGESFIVSEVPEWAHGEAAHLMDGVEMLKRDEHPIAPLLAHMEEIGTGQFVLLKTDFLPVPLLRRVQEQGYTVAAQESVTEKGIYFSYFGKF